MCLPQILHPWQEAAADLYSHPWHPDLWALCNILAQRQGGEPEDTSGSSRGAASLLPHFSAAEMLWTPILARGAGLQLKRESYSLQAPHLHSHHGMQHSVYQCEASRAAAHGKRFNGFLSRIDAGCTTRCCHALCLLDQGPKFSGSAGVLVSRETPADVLAAAARPLPTIERMRSMSMYDLYCGKHLEEGAMGAHVAQPSPFQTHTPREPQ